MLCVCFQLQVVCGMVLDERGGEHAGHDQGKGEDTYLLLSLCVPIMFNVIFVLVLPALSK